jgi:polyadenylate-binding protein
LNYSKLGKKTIRISWYNREPNNYRNNPEFNIFVKKLNKSITHKEFHDHFTQFGNVVSAKLAEDEEGEVLGYGFVLYDSAESAEKAIKAANGSEMKGKKIWVGQFIKNRPKKPVMFNNIYVKNIPKEFSEDDITKFFSRYGEIGSMLVQIPDPHHLEKLPEEKRKQILAHKFAFICFKDFDAAKRVVNLITFIKI